MSDSPKEVKECSRINKRKENGILLCTRAGTQPLPIKYFGVFYLAVYSFSLGILVEGLEGNM